MKFKTELLPHQREAVEKLSKIKVGALYMEQGTGKTRTALELISARLEREKVTHALWLCPCSAKDTGNIKNDIIKHVGYWPQNFYICGIETLSSSVKTVIGLIDFVTRNQTYLIVDESSMVKNPSAIRTSNVMRIASKCTYKLILNGTPITRNEADLFAQWYILDWRILGYKSYYSFSANHLEYDRNYPKKIVRCLNTEYLSRKIAPYTYQIKKSECINIPGKNYQTRYFRITEEQETNYWDAFELLVERVDEFKPETIYRMFSVLQKITAGYTVSVKKTYTDSYSAFERFEENPRATELIGAISDLNGEKAIIFCKYQFEIDGIMGMLKNIYGNQSAVRLDGKMGKVARRESISAFQNTAQFFVSNRNCASYSLNLQFCHNIIYYNNDWDYGTRAQSEDRVHRIGQTMPVVITDIIASDTVDERIADCVFRKERLSENFKRLLNSNNKTSLLKSMAGGADGGSNENIPPVKKCI